MKQHQKDQKGKFFSGVKKLSGVFLISHFNEPCGTKNYQALYTDNTHYCVELTTAFFFSCASLTMKNTHPESCSTLRLNVLLKYINFRWLIQQRFDFVAGVEMFSWMMLRSRRTHHSITVCL